MEKTSEKMDILFHEKESESILKGEEFECLGQRK